MTSGSDHAGSPRRAYPVLRNPAVQSGGSDSSAPASSRASGAFFRSGGAMMTSGADFVAPVTLVGEEDGELAPPLCKPPSLSPLARSTLLSSGRDTAAAGFPARRPLPPLAPLGQRGAMMTSGVVHTSRLGNAAAREQAEHDRHRVRAPQRLVQDAAELGEAEAKHAPGAATDLPTLIWHADPNENNPHERINDAL